MRVGASQSFTIFLLSRLSVATPEDVLRHADAFVCSPEVWSREFTHSGIHETEQGGHSKAIAVVG